MGCASLVAIPAVGAQPTSGSPPDGYCIPRGGLLDGVQRVAHGQRADGSTETTEYLRDSVFRVTECAIDGSVDRTELVGPIAVPGGRAALLTWSVERRVAAREYHSFSLTYRDPRDPTWAKEWQGVEAATAGVATPTPESIVVAERLADRNGALSAPQAR